MFGSASGWARNGPGVLVVVEFMLLPCGPTIAPRRGSRQSRPRHFYGSGLLFVVARRVPVSDGVRKAFGVYVALWSKQKLCRPVMEELVNPPRGLRADAVDLHQIGDRGALDRFKRAEIVQQRALAGRTDTGDLLQAGLPQIALAARPVRADRKTMRLVAQPFDKIEHRIARRQLERVAAGKKESFAAGVAIRPLGDGDQRHLDAEPDQHLARRRELALSAVDQDEGAAGRVGFFLIRLPLREKPRTG